MSQPTAFVTGGTGFLGLNLVEQLCSCGWRVIALHRPVSDTRWLLKLGAELAEGDILDPESLRRALPERAEAVFHVAGNTRLWSPGNARQTRENVLGTRNVAETALARGVKRMVHTSTVAVYGFQEGRVTEESLHLGRSSWINYFRSKALAEDAVRSAIERGLDAVIVNPANIVGPYDTGNWSRLITLIHERRLPGVPSGSGSFAHSLEVARAHLAAFEHGRRGENYLLGGVDASYLEVAHLIGELTGRKVPRRAAPDVLLRVVARFNHLRSLLTRSEPDLSPEAVALVTRRVHCSSDKAVRELGYRPLALRTMLEDCHRWMVETGRLS